MCQPYKATALSDIYIKWIPALITYTPLALHVLGKLPHCKNCGMLCTPNEQHTIGVISH